MLEFHKIALALNSIKSLSKKLYLVPGKSKIANFYIEVINQYVVRLYVSMNDPMVMQIRKDWN